MSTSSIRSSMSSRPTDRRTSASGRIACYPSFGFLILRRFDGRQLQWQFDKRFLYSIDIRWCRPTLTSEAVGMPRQ